jgi:hypothetical protein
VALERGCGPHVSRRALLSGGVLIGTGAVSSVVLSRLGNPHTSAPAAQTSPSVATGSGAIVGSDGQLLVRDHVVLREDLHVSGVVIEPAGVLEFAPDHTVTLSTSAM